MCRRMDQWVLRDGHPLDRDRIGGVQKTNYSWLKTEKACTVVTILQQNLSLSRRLLLSHLQAEHSKCSEMSTNDEDGGTKSADHRCRTRARGPDFFPPKRLEQNGDGGLLWESMWPLLSVLDVQDMSALSEQCFSSPFHSTECSLERAQGLRALEFLTDLTHVDCRSFWRCPHHLMWPKQQWETRRLEAHDVLESSRRHRERIVTTIFTTRDSLSLFECCVKSYQDTADTSKINFSTSFLLKSFSIRQHLHRSSFVLLSWMSPSWQPCLVLTQLTERSAILRSVKTRGSSSELVTATLRPVGPRCSYVFWKIYRSLSDTTPRPVSPSCSWVCLLASRACLFLHCLLLSDSFHISSPSCVMFNRSLFDVVSLLPWETPLTSWKAPFVWCVFCVILNLTFVSTWEFLFPCERPVHCGKLRTGILKRTGEALAAWSDRAGRADGDRQSDCLSRAGVFLVAFSLCSGALVEQESLVKHWRPLV